jgi:hypothetical protein
MKNNFEKEFNQVMNESKEMPSNVRKSLDKSYDLILAKSKKKKSNLIWKKVTAAACALLVTGVVLTNEHAIAGINEFFKFGDQGIERAITEGFTQVSNSTATDQDIKVTLERNFSDANKLGMSFQLLFEDSTLLENDVKEISLDFRLKNGDGEYLLEFIPDTKPLKGNSRYVSVIERKNSVVDVKTGKVQFEFIANANEGTIPSLKDAVVEIESINIFYGNEEFKKIDGEWNVNVENTFKENADSVIEYAMHDKTSIIQVSSAKANPTSLNLTFSLEGLYTNEKVFADMKILDEYGKVYPSKDFGISNKDNKTFISTNFPLTSYNKSKKLTLIVEGIGEVELLLK